MKKYQFAVYILVVSLLYACVPESKRTLTKVESSISSLDFRKIHDLEQKGQTDSLIQLLSSSDPTRRFLAAQAFASHHDTKALDSLYNLLDDPALKVRSMAAYAIGQLGQSSSEEFLIGGFRQRDTMSVDNSGNGEILRALGKVAGAPISKFIASAEGYRSEDTLLIEGQMKSLYHFALRGIHNPTITQKVVETLRNSKTSNKAKLYAAHYLSRPQDLDIEKVKFQISESMVNESDPKVKMALVSALKRTEDPEIHSILINQLALEQDYRVKCNIIRALGHFDKIKNVPMILELLRSDNVHIARTAAEYVSNYGDPKNAHRYRDVAKDSIDPRVKADIYNAVFKILPHYYAKTKNATRWQVQQAITKDSSLYSTIGYLHALGHDPENYGFIIDYIEKSDNAVIKTAGMEALGTILAHDDFNAIYQSVSRSNRRKILAYIKEAILSNDEGIVAAAADIIADPNTGMKELIDSTNFLLTAKANLQMPGQIESIHAVERALAHLRGVTKATLTTMDATKAINWKALTEYNNTKAIVKTTKGNFTIQLLLDESPGSVINFIDLANAKYYQNKVFHRVVPNFVIQTGSPRGDNYGGADYTIRSELGPQSYDDEGYVGMASAGLHTESTQWFVTHSPAPHLDGKYSIFGKVTEGMDVVHAMQVGDSIIDIIISNL